MLTCSTNHLIRYTRPEVMTDNLEIYMIKWKHSHLHKAKRIREFYHWCFIICDWTDIGLVATA